MVKGLPAQTSRRGILHAHLDGYISLLKSSGIAMIVVDRDATIVLANERFEQFSGYPKKSLEGKRRWTEFLTNDDPARAKAYRVFTGNHSGRPAKSYEFKFIDGKEITKDVAIVKEPIKGTRGALISFVDITEIIAGKEKTRISEEKYRSLVESTDDSVYMIDRDCRYLFVNGQMLKRLHVKGKDIMKKRYSDFHDAEDAKEFKGYVNKIFQTGVSYRYEYKSRTEDRYTLRTLSPIIEKNDGKVKFVAVVSKDITDLKKTEEKLKYLSLHDPLTSLYNRAYFEEEMHRLDNSRLEFVGLIVCDIDGLKLINDTLGHDKGDELLITASNVIKQSFRESDVVARVGGDEFAILLPNSPRSKVEDICRRIKQAVVVYNRKKPLVPLSISKGFAIRGNLNQTMAELYREADNNMYKEKLYGGQRARHTIVKNLIGAAEARGLADKNSLARFQKLTTAFAQAIDLPEERIKDLYLLGQFHDIGNVSIHDYVLRKPGRLTREELVEIQKHCDIGHRIAQSAPDLASISDFILKHHEWWDGNGYPLGLKGSDIPLESRLIAIVDAYVAMTAGRPHRPPMIPKKALKELKRCAGTQFDPSLVDAFVDLMKKSASL
ncbi:MAG TPA: diguanylate cyclase [Syntrophorhabdaceae bacterium]|nr:diguanylate cyclase [Syntrophorhabdaceae bacterium]